MSIQVGLLDILLYRCQVKAPENPQYARTASTTISVVVAKMLMSSLKTSKEDMATQPMATTNAMATAHATVAVLVVVMLRCLSQRKGRGSVAGRDSESNWNL